MQFDYERRFSGLKKLYGDDAFEKLNDTEVFIIGIGGVGSWAAEAICRSGVKKITLIDLDVIAESNVNRQIHALSSTLGESKVEAMQKRLYEINQECEVKVIDDFLTENNMQELLQASCKNSWIIDAIDEVKVKIALIRFAKSHKRKIICSGAAGGKIDASKIIIDDLSKTYHDKICTKIKSELKKQQKTSDKKFGIPFAFSTENGISIKNSQGGLNCAGYGSLMMVTATMGILMANYVLNKIMQKS